MAAMDLEKSGAKKTFYLTGTKNSDQLKAGEKLVYDIWKIDANEYPRQIKLYARVFDTTGNFITNLAPPVHANQEYWKALSEKLGQKTTQISSFTVREYGDQDSIPYAINLMLDYSGSMKSVMDALYDGTELFISLKQSVDQIAITSFNRDFDLKVPFASDKQLLVSKFRQTRDRGFGSYSAFYDGLVNSIKMFDSLPSTMPRILVAFSDGDDNFSQSKARDIFREAQERNVHIFTVGFGYTHDDILSYISQNTGGKYYQVYTKKDLINVFMEIYRSLRNYYLVSYEPPKFAGLHHVALTLQLPQSDTLIARGEYDESDINPFRDPDNPIYKRIPFDYNQATLKPDAESIIEELVDQLQRYEKVWLEVQGHTDNIGGEDFNQRLSEARAQAVVNALVQHGIEAKRLKPVGKGMLYPLVANDNDENRAINRRTEFRILRR